jgi:hypothetical protein
MAVEVNPAAAESGSMALEGVSLLGKWASINIEDGSAAGELGSTAIEVNPTAAERRLWR